MIRPSQYGDFCHWRLTLDGDSLLHNLVLRFNSPLTPETLSPSGRGKDYVLPK